MGNFCQKSKVEQFEVVKDEEKIEETEHPIKAVDTKENVENPENEENQENMCQEEEQEPENHEPENQEPENQEPEKQQIQEIHYSPVKSLNEEVEQRNSQQPVEYQQYYENIQQNVQPDAQYVKASTPMQIEQSIQEDMRKITESYGKLGQNIVFHHIGEGQNIAMPNELPPNVLQAIQDDPNAINSPQFDQYFKIEQSQPVPQTIPSEIPQQYQAFENMQIHETNQSLQMPQMQLLQNTILPPEIESEINSQYIQSSIPLVQYQNIQSIPVHYQQVEPNVYSSYEHIHGDSHINIPVNSSIPLDNILGSHVTFGTNSMGYI